MVMALPEGIYERYKRQSHPSYYGRMKLTSNANVNIGSRNGRYNQNQYSVR